MPWKNLTQPDRSALLIARVLMCPPKAGFETESLNIWGAVSLPESSKNIPACLLEQTPSNGAHTIHWAHVINKSHSISQLGT